MFLAPAFSFSSRCSSHFLLRRASVLVSLVLAAALGLSVEPARAELIDIEFTGRITTSLIESTVFGTDENVSYEPGTPITGSISINAGATDSIPGGEIDQFNVDSSNATQENLPGAQWRLSVGATLPNLALPAEFVSGPFSTELTPLFLNQPTIGVRLEDSPGGDLFSFSQSSRGGGTQLPFDSLAFTLSDPDATAFPGSNSLTGSLAQLNTLLANGAAPFTGATGTFIYSRTPRLSRIRVEAQFEVTSLTVVSTTDNPLPVELISARSDGLGGGDGNSRNSSLSADAQMVAFSTDATDLADQNANGAIRDILVLNRATGQVINLTSGGNGNSENPVLSADGQWLAFATQATNLPTDVPDTNGAMTDIVLANLGSGELVLVTAGANGPSSTPTINADGSHLAFDTLSNNLAEGNYQPLECNPTDPSVEPCYSNILLYDRRSRLLLNVSQGGLSDARAPALSEVGDHLVFNSEAFAPRSTLVFMDLNSGERREVGNFPLTIDGSVPHLSANARWVTVLDTPRDPNAALQPSVYLYDLDNDQEYRLDTTTRLAGDFSDDERFLFLASNSTDLDLPDTNGAVQDIYRLDLSTAPWSESSPPAASFERVTEGGLEDSGWPSTNHDGSILVWDSTASNFADDNNGSNSDVFLRDLNGLNGNQDNRSPSANPQNLSVPSGEDLGIVLSGFDPDGDDLEFTVLFQPAQGTLSGTPPELTYTSVEGFIGTDTFTFTTSDGETTSAAASIQIAVTRVNNVPVGLGPTEVFTAEDTAVAITLEGSDLDGDALTFEVTSEPVNGTLSGSAPDLNYAPANNFNGTDAFSFAVSDGSLTSEPVTVTLTIQPINDPPVPVAQSLTTAANTPIAIRLTADDVDNQQLSFAIVGFPANGNLTGRLPDLLYSPDPGFAGVDSFEFNVTDGIDSSDDTLVMIEVAAAPVPPPPENNVPSAAPLSVSTAQQMAVVIVLGGSDADNDPLAFSVETPPANGSLSGEAPNLVYTPNAAYTGQDNFSYTVRDQQDTSEPVQVSITIFDPSVNLLSAVLPASRSVSVGTTATAFATLINAGTTDATQCALHLPAALAAPAAPAGRVTEFFYQSTDPTTNELLSEPNQPLNVPAGTARSFVFGITLGEAMPATQIALQFRCTNAADAASIIGLNTFLLSASSEPVPDLIALAATATNNGVMELGNNRGVFAAASINVGSAAQISVSADTGAANLPIGLNLCQTDPVTSVCFNPPEAAPDPVLVDIAAGDSPTFAVFAESAEPIALDPARSRVFLRFRDPEGEVRGATSVAVENRQ